MIESLTVFKVLPAPDWQAACAQGHYAGSSDDARDGFIHLSLAHQLQTTLAKHFTGQPDLLLLEFGAARLAPALRFEASRGGALFPHLYGPLATDHAARSWPLPLSDGQHVLPAEVERTGLAQAEDSATLEACLRRHYTAC